MYTVTQILTSSGIKFEKYGKPPASGVFLTPGNQLIGTYSDLQRFQRSDPAYAGWHGLSERRVRNKADELAKRHFRLVAGTLDPLFRAERYEVLVVGGHEHELPRFLEFLPRSLRERLAGTFSIDPHTAGSATVRPPAEAILEGYELEHQRRAVGELLEAAAAGGLATVGLEPCLAGGSVAAIRTLLVHDGAIAPGVV